MTATPVHHVNFDRHLNSRQTFKQNRSPALTERQLEAGGRRGLSPGDRFASG